MPLRFKVDENLPRRVESALRDLGHDVETALTEGLAGAADSNLLSAAATEDRILITLDLDFGDLREYPPRTHRGIWVLRPPQQAFETVLALVLAGTRLAALERTDGQLWVIDQKRVRIRD